MGDQFDVRLTDEELLAEIELVTDMIVAAKASDSSLPQDRIDGILGIEPPHVPGQRRPRSDH